MLKQRIITGLILAPLLLMAIFMLPSDQLRWVFAGVIFIGGWEWTRLAALKIHESIAFYVALAGGMYAIHVWPKQLLIDQWLLWASFIWWTGIAIIILRYEPKKVDHAQLTVRLSKFLMGIMTLVPAWWALGQLHSLGGQGVTYLIFSFFIVWAADVGAYFAGKKLGKNKLAPNVSPGKTIEGMIGGLICVALVSLCFGLYLEFKNIDLLLLIVVSVVVGVFSVFGDLFESLLKRQVGMKDSSQLLPGHGGVLDRIDSILAAAPLFLFGLTQFVDLPWWKF